MEQTSRKLVSASMIVGLISALLVFIGMFLPMLDLTAFHAKIDIQYNMFKVCENIGLISSAWKGVPYGMIIGVIAMVILSFVDIPVLKLIPCMIILAMLLIMLIDMGNILNWGRDMLERYHLGGAVELENSNILKSFTVGIYLMAAGFLTGIVSCFCPGKGSIQIV